nr:MAG TPA: hypothetical protein [Caudoviricetes sp.]
MILQIYLNTLRYTQFPHPPRSSDFLDLLLCYHNISLLSIGNHEILDFCFFV